MNKARVLVNPLHPRTAARAVRAMEVAYGKAAPPAIVVEILSLASFRLKRI